VAVLMFGLAAGTSTSDRKVTSIGQQSLRSVVFFIGS